MDEYNYSNLKKKRTKNRCTHLVCVCVWFFIGGEQKFSVDPVTGAVKVAWRGQFVEGNPYSKHVNYTNLCHFQSSFRIGHDFNFEKLLLHMQFT